MIRACWSN